MVPTAAVVRCTCCGAHLARDNHGTVCSPCQRSQIESSARRNALISHEGKRIKAAFDSSGLYGVADEFDCSPVEALHLLLSARMVPVVSPRRRALLEQVVALRDRSHVDVAAALHISRWTVATYRAQLGIERSPISARACARSATPA
jgi:hypothetical protein